MKLIKLDLQMFAKTSSQMKQYRKSIAISKYQTTSSTGSSQVKQTPVVKTKGEAVARVSKQETYEIYRVANGKEEYKKDQTGDVILEKMYWNANINSWVSKDKGYKYKIRRKR